MKFPLLLLFLIATDCSAQELLYLNASSMVCGVAESAFTSERRININPSAMMNATGTLLSTSVVSNYFLKEMSTTSIAGSIKFGENTRINFGLATAGDKAFRKQGGTISIAKKLANGFSMGLGLDGKLYQYNTERYSNLSSFAPSVFLHVDLSRQLVAGMIIRNPTRVKIANSNFNEPSWISSSLCYKSGKAQIAIGVELVNQQSENLVIGIESELVTGFCIRTGYQSFPQSLNFGTGIIWHNLLIDVGCRLQPTAGSSTALTLSIPVK